MELTKKLAKKSMKMELAKKSMKMELTKKSIKMELTKKLREKFLMMHFFSLFFLKKRVRRLGWSGGFHPNCFCSNDCCLNRFRHNSFVSELLELGPLVFLRKFFLRNAPAGNHQLVAEDLMEDGTISRISNAYSHRRGRRLPPTLEVEVLQFVIVIVI
jgi:hypothetical protein